MTGAGRGVGHAVAVTLAYGGASVIVNDICVELGQKTTDEITSFGGVALDWAVDVIIVEEIQKMVAYPLQQFGTIDILVNNAGILGDSLGSKIFRPRNGTV